MKLQFNIGMQFIFGYTDEVNSAGPTFDWRVAVESNDYLIKLLKDGITSKHPKDKPRNIANYNKLRTLKKL